jgi:hypothetical protein
VLVLCQPEIKRFRDRGIVGTSVSDNMMGRCQVNVGDALVDRVKGTCLDGMYVKIMVVWIVVFSEFPVLVVLPEYRGCMIILP